MDDRELIAGSYANNATLANTVLLLLDRLRAAPDLTLLESQRRSLGSLRDLLSGSANGAKSIVKASDLSPAGGRSLADDLARYGIVRKVKADLDPKDLEIWTRRAAEAVEQLEQRSYAELDEDNREWIDRDLEPFLDELAKIDGLLDGDEFEIQAQDIAAA